MEYYIKGCVDCPFYYDDTDGQVGTICHHISAPMAKGFWNDGRFTEVSDEDFKGKEEKLVDQGYYTKKPLDIELSPFAGNDPITPSWCPLRIEHITIALKQPEQ